MEAQSQGLAFVATRVSAVPELIEDGATGLLVPPEDPAALAAALESLIRTPSRRLFLGRAAERRVRETLLLRRRDRRAGRRSSGCARRRRPALGASGGRLMRIAFYAPMKPPTDPVPSGDRHMARLLMAALRPGRARGDARLASSRAATAPATARCRRSCGRRASPPASG